MNKKILGINLFMVFLLFCLPLISLCELVQAGTLTPTPTPIEEEFSWDGPILTKQKGVNWGPTGKETYYNLDMSGIISAANPGGWVYEQCVDKELIDEILELDEPYYVREDGCKMFGDYIIVAANLNHFPRGSIVGCSLGKAIVLDTGGFANQENGWDWLDIATNW